MLAANSERGKKGGVGRVREEKERIWEKVEKMKPGLSGGRESDQRFV